MYGRRPEATRSTVRLEARPSDFDQRGRVSVYSGTCSCCCCLHWAGAALGGIVGLRRGWVGAKQRRDAPLHPSARRNVILGAVIGAIVTAGLLVLVSQMRAGESLLLPVALVPPVVFIPIGGGMIAGALLARARHSQDFTDSGYYCVNCLYDLRGSTSADRCPECGKKLDWLSLERGMHFGVRAAWRATWMALVLSVVGGALGYGVMFLACNLN